MSNSSMPLVSVVLPVYNGEKYLAISVESCINQTYQNWELLIIDDGSSDRTPEIAKCFEQQDERIHYYKNEKNLKLPGALNRGFSLAKGEYLTWTSDDNYYRPQALEKMVASLLEGDAEFVFTDYSIIDEEGNETELVQIPKDYRYRIWCANVVGACFMYSKKVYETIGGYDDELFLVEDYDYWLRIVNVFPVTIINENLYAYRLHAGALTAMHIEGRYEAHEKVLLKNIRNKEDVRAIDKCFLYRGLHRSRRYKKKFFEKYHYFIKAVCYELWRRIFYRGK